MSITGMGEFIASHEEALLWLGVLSLLAFVGTLLAVPWMVVRIPHDYFTRPRGSPLRGAARPPASRLLLLVGKNLLGGLFILLGFTMLVLPGQGLLTILIGILLMDFPGKFEFECWLIKRGPILRSVNWLRERHGCRPLSFEE